MISLQLPLYYCPPPHTQTHTHTHTHTHTPTYTTSRICCEACVGYYRGVLSFVPGGASLIAFVALGFLVLLIYLRRRQCRGEV